MNNALGSAMKCLSVALLVSGSCTLALAQGAAASSPGAEFDRARWERMIDAAKKEGEVTLYSTNTPDQIQDVKKGFEKKYPGISMSFFRGSQPAMLAKLGIEKETGAPGGDLVTFPWDPWFTKTVKDGDLVPPMGPAAASNDWKGNKHLKGAYAPTNFFVLGMAWNTKNVSVPLKTFTDLLRPEFANGKIGIVEPVTTAVYDFYLFLEEKFGPDYLAKLALQRPKIYASAVGLMQSVASGEVSVANYATPSIWDQKAKGAPVDFVVPVPGWTLPTYTAVVRWSKHPNAAQLLMDYMMSREGQEALAKGGASAIKGVSISLADPDSFAPQDLSRLTPEFVQQYSARWNRIFGR